MSISDKSSADKKKSFEPDYVPYINKSLFSSYGYRLLNPTGRWKIETTPYYKDLIFIEHKGFIFKSWIPEDRIVFLRRSKTEIFECKKYEPGCGFNCENNECTK